MKERRPHLSLIFLCALMIASVSGYSGEYIVKMKSDNVIQASSTLSSLYELKVATRHKEGRLLKIVVPEQKKEAVLKSLAQRHDIEYIVENVVLKALAIPNDPELSKQWALEKVNASEAWKLSPGSNKVVVAVIDTGIDLDHEDIAANLWTNPKETANGKDDDNNGLVDDIHGWDFIDNDNKPDDKTGAMNPGHGTHCAGIIGAVGNNNKGISGINQVVSLMPLRFLNEKGEGDLMKAIEAVDLATAYGVQIISASFGATVPEAAAKPLIEAIERAIAKGIIVVVAAANDGKDNDRTSVYPANVKNVIAVAASNRGDTKPQWSNFGQKMVHVAAPGEEIYSTLPGNKYGNLSGTSMATPLVAGIVALMKSIDSELTSQQALSYLQITGAPVAIKTACDCRVDAAAALDAVLNKRLVPIPAAATLKVGEEIQFSAAGGKPPYHFSSSDEKIASISEDGKLKALADGKVEITVKDAEKTSVKSKAIWVGGKAREPSTDCPFEEPLFCQISCVFMPDMPWCDGQDNGFPFPIPKD